MNQGFVYEKEESYVPDSDAELEEEFRPEEVTGQLRVARGGKVPLHPAMIRFPASMLGRAASELTGCPGLALTDQEREDLAEMWIQCGVEANPLVQALLATVAMLAIKGLHYKAWDRAGRPGDLKTKEAEGA